MTPKEIRLVQQSLPAVLALRDTAPARLDEQIVRLNAGAQPLFAAVAASRQAVLLITAVAMAIEALGRGDHRLAETAVCQYHPRWGIGAHHFRGAGVVLVKVLAQQLGSEFTADLADAWTSACEWVGRMALQPRHSYAA
jgi:hemoglobin-like flavoprotein